MTTTTDTQSASVFADFIELTKPRITVLVAMTTMLGFYVGMEGGFGGVKFLHAVLATLAVVASANVFNQVFERDVDARMERTATRPLPAGRRSVGEASALGMFLGVGGVVYLAVAVNMLTAVIGVLALVIYVFIYTPLKQKSWTCTLVGAVPGALPPVMGWTAARGELGVEAAILFGILFFWQLPHFWAIGWMFREEYGAAGLPMLPVIDDSGARTAVYSLVTCVAMILVSLAPVAIDMHGIMYGAGALIVGIVFLAPCIQFARARTRETARRMLLGSVVYLPVLIGLMMLDTKFG